MTIITLNTVDSTNLYAKCNFDNLSDGDIVSAIHQTSGRGRFTRKWIDLGEGNVFLTFVLKNKNEFFEKSYINLTQFLSVILCKYFEALGLKPQIKWPNDILINNKKISGILAQTVMHGDALKGIILGVGINLKADSDLISRLIDKEATALNIELNSEISRDGFISELTNMFFQEYYSYIKTGFEYIKTDYLSRLAFLDSQITVSVLNNKKSGIIKTVNDYGELVLLSDGKETVLSIGDIL